MKALAALGLVVILTGCGMTAPSGNPGFADVDPPSGRGLSTDIALSLGPRLLRLAAAQIDDEPETQELLRSLDGVRVTVWQLSPEADRLILEEQMVAASSTLTADAWEQVVRVRDGTEVVYVLIKPGDESIAGLAVFVLDDAEFVFVNVMGQLNPELITRMAREQSVPGLGRAGDAVDWSWSEADQALASEIPPSRG
jgi:hypothetical protein